MGDFLNLDSTQSGVLETELNAGKFLLSEEELEQGGPFYIPDRHLRAPELLIPGRQPTGFRQGEIDWNGTPIGEFAPFLLEAYFNGRRYAKYPDDGQANPPRLSAPGWYQYQVAHTGSPWLFASKNVVGFGKYHITDLTANNSFILGHYQWNDNTDNGGYRIRTNTSGQIEYNVRNNSSEGNQTITTPTFSVGDTIYIRWKSNTNGYFSVTVWDDNNAPSLVFSDHTFTAGRSDTMANSESRQGRGGVVCEWALVFDSTTTGGPSATEATIIAQDPYSILKPRGT